MLTKVNQILPTITLFFLIVAIYMLNSSQKQAQTYLSQSEQAQQRLANITTEQERLSLIMQNDLTKLESAQAAQAVRIVRIESDLCSLKLARMVQCP